ncbi:MAG: polyhydroxyalkanoic acid system family protein [Xanthomonadaceae bacterium]|nr:polyhydroxyalkanoic acid system family protein [Xanthomonadaceae bacterium]MDE1959304.1 polyhydroxyalkanoic acid system family protein [Xanthomonadaceae bacterium]MDE2179042.1 polyhydroxyalkanoic acid system family protein [Xanthomonadaceae bacterium]MDE2245544.1 polyhydroxyalkanoic acid system family protein [Xanthomonadaceae bacterium]
MPSIDITRTHAVGLQEARTTVDELAAAMRERFGVDCAWQGNTLAFRRSGVNGAIEVAKDRVRVHADLSFLLLALKPTIEEEIRRHLEAHFG